MSWGLGILREESSKDIGSNTGEGGILALALLRSHSKRNLVIDVESTAGNDILI
jgi:hypothetical protein